MKESAMAANQTSKQKSSNHRNQASQLTRPGGTAEAQESSSGYGEMVQQASDYVSESASEMQDCIREHSGTSVMVSLVAGFGIGLLVGRALTRPEPESRSRRYRSAAEGVGRRLMDRIEAMIPDALAEHFGK